MISLPQHLMSSSSCFAKHQKLPLMSGMSGFFGMVKAVSHLLGIMSKHVLTPIMKVDLTKTEGWMVQERVTYIFRFGNFRF